MSNFYTGKGDKGVSHVGLVKIPKTDIAMEALGDLDELNSFLGIIKNLPTTSWSAPSLLRRGKKRNTLTISSPYQGEVSEGGRGGELFKILETIQQDLFIIQAHAAAFMFSKLYRPPRFSHEKVQMLEKQIAGFEKKLKPLRKFVIPGSTELSAWFDVVRTVTRRAERSVVKLSKKQKISKDILAYLNRLSSLFFVLGRVTVGDHQEKNPRYH